VEMDYSVTTAENNQTNALALAKAKGKDFLEEHVVAPELMAGDYDFGELLIELQKTRKQPVRVAVTLVKNLGGWITNHVDINSIGEGRLQEIEAGFAQANIGFVFAKESTLVVPLARKAEFQKIYDTKGIAPFKNGPPDPKVLKAREKRYSL